MFFFLFDVYLPLSGVLQNNYMHSDKCSKNLTNTVTEEEKRRRHASLEKYKVGMSDEMINAKII